MWPVLLLHTHPVMGALAIARRDQWTMDDSVADGSRLGCDAEHSVLPPTIAAIHAASLAPVDLPRSRPHALPLALHPIHIVSIACAQFEAPAHRTRA